jgi:hypothetical protein
MITMLDFTKLQEEASSLKAELEVLRSVDVSAIKAEYETQITNLKAEVELLKSEDSIKATEVYKAIVSENETHKQTISTLQEEAKTLAVDKENNDKLVNTLVCEKLASVGVAPIKVQIEKQEKVNPYYIKIK